MAQNPINISDLSLDELALRLAEWKEPAFRAKQVFEWIYHKNASDHAAMTSLSKELRDRLAKKLPFPVLHETARRVSRDGTMKFLWSLYDGQKIETVLIPMEEHNTLCISSQAGCRFGCRFCASGIGGFKRDLSCSEIVGQVLNVRRAAKGAVTHIVFMGIGEPRCTLKSNGYWTTWKQSIFN